ncbi:GNAT family N-acetyltransferase [Halorussus sp. MSC15.2]|uniref:GNAT family N-acetyltransferase n=1 Tax=Halorussus sp. MSC15.2 TaxID=2283638 RepID=UPI0013D0ABFA|nr:GNAT family N-acetyltransferase [Halorussus sp. MSC15.2]NEU58109.1 GNAT family N-acetyltransferase [Halorussus sp. MSC15.2]
MNVRDLSAEWRSEWDEFCRESPDAWFRHTTDWLDYTLNYKPEFDPASESFMVTHSKEIIAVCPLILETVDGVRQFTYAGGYGPTPAFSADLSEGERDTIEGMIFDEVDERAAEHGVQRVKMQHPSLAEETPTGTESYNYLVRHGFVDTSIHTQLVDLDRDIDDIRADLRRDYRRSIDDAADTFEATVFDSENVTESIHDQYKQCHIKDAGGQTRPDETFEMMYDWITADEAFLVGAKYEGEYVGFSYFLAYDGGVYYASSARDPDSDTYDLGIGHLLQWEAMKWMVERGLDTYEPGWQFFDRTFPHLASDKEVNISQFKRGVGGTTRPLSRGEKYYDGDLFREEYTEKVERYAEYLETGG